jgi:hypothetical protein
MYQIWSYYLIGANEISPLSLRFEINNDNNNDNLDQCFSTLIRGPLLLLDLIYAAPQIIVCLSYMYKFVCVYFYKKKYIYF